ncbi:MAG: hypothetical protein RLZZ126_1715 [Pseudomonadota bacterium]|jgi:AraC-like DNA-binding protein
MAFDLSMVDLAMRAAAASLLLLHVLLALTGGLDRARRFTLATFVASIVSYLLCSHPAFRLLPSLGWVIVLCFCLMSAPLLWLLVWQVFDDAFVWRPTVWLLLVGTLAMGWLAVLQIGGPVVSAVHKLMLIGFALASLWQVVRDWRSDLVARRRRLRTWVTGTLGVYVLVVLAFELAFMGVMPPQGLMLLHLSGITVLAGWTALVFVQHPAHDWLVPAALAEAPLTGQVDPPRLTPVPPVLNRKSALQQRLRSAMSEGRAYAREGLSLSQLAEQLDASPAQLREAIHHGLGYRNFNDFLHHCRVDEAAQRLLAQDLPVLSIALDVGYGSIGPFNRAFKQIKGVTPTKYKLQKK